LRLWPRTPASCATCSLWTWLKRVPREAAKTLGVTEQRPLETGASRQSKLSVLMSKLMVD
jgi:hypothetical protein